MATDQRYGRQRTTVALVVVILLVSVSAVGLVGASTTPAPTTTAEPTAATAFANGSPATATPVSREAISAVETNSTAAETANTTVDTETYLLVLDDELAVGPIQTTTDITQAKQEAERAQAPVVGRLEARDVEVATQFWITNAIMTTVDPEVTTPSDLQAIDGVTRVEPNVKFQHPEPQPSSEEAPTAEPAATTDALGETTYGLAAINVDDFVDTYNSNGSGTRVAVLDDGLNESHPDLRVARGVNVSDGSVSDPATTTLQQGNGHGDHVAGTAVGTPAPAGDIPRYSVAPDAELLKADVFVDGATLADILAAIQWAVETDADVITMSLGISASETDSTVILSVNDAIDNANDAGTVVIGSAGNNGDGTIGGAVNSPGAEFPSGSIGAVGQDGDVASFSSGAQITPDTTVVVEDGSAVSYPDHYPHTYVKPDITAPGVSVVSAGPLGSQIQANATYSIASGTSMAAPHVAGAVALLQSATATKREPDVLMNALAETATKPDGSTTTSRDIRYGMGRVDVLAARTALEETTPIEGTVTGTGDRLTGARVTTDSGVIAATDNGAYAIEPTMDATTVAVTANEYGYVPATVGVPTGGSKTLDFELDKIESLQVELNDTEIETTSTTDLTVKAAHTDGTESDITGVATVTNSNRSVATVDNTTIRGETAGTTTVSARYDGFVASRELTVTEQAVPANFTVAINDDASTTSVVAGEDTIVNATITNTGDETATQTINFSVNGTNRANTSVTIAGGSSKDIEFTDTAKPADDGATASIISGNDTADRTLTVDNPATFTVSELDPQELTVTVGQRFDVATTITNTGDRSDTQDIELRTEPTNGTVLETESNVSLTGGDSMTVTFESSVDQVETFNHTVASANGSATGTLIVEAPSDPTQRALQIAGKDDPAELTQRDVSNTITLFERNEQANGIDITQRDVSNVITLFERK